MASNTGTERSHPANRLSDESGHIGQKCSHSHKSTPLQPNKTANQTNAKTNEGNNDKDQNQRRRGDGTNKRANPLDSFSDKSGHIGQNGSDSNGCFSMKTFHLSN